VAEAIKLVSGAEAVRKLARTGWKASRQKGSHVIQYTLAIPQHRELGPGLLMRKLLKQADVGTDQFNAL
jgi:predicted RNA binding protein YcfA (HicA-like mRNA interferase family)